MSSLGKKLKHSVSRSVLNAVQGKSCVEAQSGRFSMDDSTTISTPSTPMSSTFAASSDASSTTTVSSVPSVLASVENFDPSLIGQHIRNRASLDRALDAEPTPKSAPGLAPPPYHKPEDAQAGFSRRQSTEADRSAVGRCKSCGGAVGPGDKHQCPR